MDKNETKTALDAGRALGSILAVPKAQAEAAEFAVVPDGYEVKSLEWFKDAPARIAINPAFLDLESFIGYVKEFKTDGSKVFVAVQDNGVSFVAAIDYHQPGKPAWIGHRAHYSAVPTQEWMRWKNMDKKPMKQTQFAEFLESNQLAIVEPTGADLLEVVQTLEGHNNAKFKAVKRLTNGKQQLEYMEDIVLQGQTGSNAGTMEMPSMLKLGIAPFQGGSNYAVAARLRYRISGQEISFQYELIDPHLVIKDVVGEMISALERECGIKALQGTF